jgi:hypothetical protein
VLGAENGTAYLLHVSPGGVRSTMHIAPSSGTLETKSRCQEAGTETRSFQIVPIGTGNGPEFGLRRCSLLLCAEQDGRITLSRNKFGPWERFRRLD